MKKKIKKSILFVSVILLATCSKSENKLTIVFPNNFSSISTNTPVTLEGKIVGFVEDFENRDDEYLVVYIKLDTTVSLSNQTRFTLIQFIESRNSQIKIETPEVVLRKGEFFGTVSDSLINDYSKISRDSLKNIFLNDTTLINNFPEVIEILKKGN